MKKVKQLRFMAGSPMLLLGLFIFVFSLLLTILLDWTTSHIRRDSTTINEDILTYLEQAFPQNVDNAYLHQIDQPMEQFFNSSACTSFFFCTPQYPASPDLRAHLTADLTRFVSNSPYISGAFIYAAASNDYMVSRDLPFSSIERTAPGEPVEDILYQYNSNTLEKNQIAEGTHHTFFFQYEDYVIISKDLTIASGVPYGTLFLVLNKGNIATLLYDSHPSVIPYTVSMYDSRNQLLYSNIGSGESFTPSQLISLAAGEPFSNESPSTHLIYCTSDLLRLQFILEVNRQLLPGQPPNLVYLHAIRLLTISLITLLVLVLLYALFHKPVVHLFDELGIQDAERRGSIQSSYSAVKMRIVSLLAENTTLKEIVSTTSYHALSSLFTCLVIGQTVEEATLSSTLANTSYGFCTNDIYVAGILHSSQANLMNAEQRTRILNLLNATFNKYMEKIDCNAIAFPFDEKSFVIIISFASDTSISKGKSKLKELHKLLEESMALSSFPIIIAFGHMYNSVLDLSFSYNEAFKSMHALSEMLQKPTELPTIQANDDVFIDVDFIDRRAWQFTHLLSNGRKDETDKFIERTIEDIFHDSNYENRRTNCRRLVSAVTDNMISYPFVIDSQLSDVYGQLALKIDAGMTSADLQICTKDALHLLGEDFSNIIKKQQNPYILATRSYIEANYSNSDLSLEEIAESLNIAPNYLSTIFSKNLGKKLFEYVNEYRLEKSIHLLLHTDMSINDISQESGFGSSRNYIRIFKKYKDTTPGAYRKQQLEANKTRASNHG